MKSKFSFSNNIIFPLGIYFLLLTTATNFLRAQPTNSNSTNSVSEAPTVIPVLQIKADQVVAEVSPTLYGLMTEDINFALEGGLYAELIRNRTFKANPTNAVYWITVGTGAISVDASTPLNNALNVSLKLDASLASKDSPAGFMNAGFWGIPVHPDSKYSVSFFAKSDGRFSGALTVKLQSSDGKTVYSSAEISGKNLLSRC